MRLPLTLTRHSLTARSSQDVSQTAPLAQTRRDHLRSAPRKDSCAPNPRKEVANMRTYSLTLR